MNTRMIVIISLLVIVAVATLTSAVIDVLNRRDAQRSAEAVSSAFDSTDSEY